MSEPEARIATLRRQVQRGEYRVDRDAVAGAILRRLREVARAQAEVDRDRAGAQSVCSYPVSSPSAPANATPAPATVRPIHVIRPAPSRVANAA